MLPDLLGGGGDDGRGEAQQRARDAIDSRLGGAPRSSSARKRVEAILQHIEIERAELYNGEIVQGVEDAVELEILVPFAAITHQLRGAREHPAVELFHLVVGNGVARRVEIGEVPQRE